MVKAGYPKAAADTLAANNTAAQMSLRPLRSLAVAALLATLAASCASSAVDAVSSATAAIAESALRPTAHRKALLVVAAAPNGSVAKVASAVAEVLDAEIASPRQLEPGDLGGYALVGFGSAIFHGRNQAQLIDFAERLPRQAGRKAFISRPTEAFSHRGGGQGPRELDREPC